MKLIYSCILMSNVIFATAQQFSAKIYFSSGSSKDSITVGYDPAATNLVDPSFGEADIQNAPWKAFEVRISHNSLQQCPKMLNDYAFQSKKQIIKSTCGLKTPNSILIKSFQYPVKIKWTKSQFNTICDQADLITDVPPGGWIDAFCASPPQMAYFKASDSLMLSKPFAQYTIMGNDTLNTIFYGSLNQPDFINEINHNSISVFPNPTSGILNVKFTSGQTDANAEIHNYVGQKVFSANTAPEINVSHLPAGQYFLKVSDGTNSFWSRFIKCD